MGASRRRRAVPAALTSTVSPEAAAPRSTSRPGRSADRSERSARSDGSVQPDTPDTSRPSSRPPKLPFVIADTVTRAVHAAPYERAPADPVFRRLRVFTQDPATSRQDIPIATLNVPYEPLGEGPSGAIIEVIDYNATRHETYAPVDLNDLRLAIEDGVKPSTTDPRFAQQMTYAVTMLTYDRFRQALGRVPDFSFDAPAPRPAHVIDEAPRVRLRIRPHGMEEDNAWYDPDACELAFGYTFANRRARGLDQPDSLVLTALSHDIVAHEMTHALLDGMRARFMLPSNPDVGAFHEAFADLVALFQRFRFRDLVERAIAQADGGLDSRLLTDIARQFGKTTGDGRNALRTALLDRGTDDEPVKKAFRYDSRKEEHDLGAVLVAAVFEAFSRVFQRKTEDLRRIARQLGGPLSASMVALIARRAEDLAEQFLNIIIRAVDYCPPVDLTFGEFLRAILTADAEVVPDDPWGYREAFVQAFRRYGIEVSGVPDLSEDALLWQPPEQPFPVIPRLAFPNLRHGSDPAKHRPPNPLTGENEGRDRAAALGEFVMAPGRAWYFGLAEAGATRRGRVEPPVIQSVRTLRRNSPQGDVVFELVAEITQRRFVRNRVWMYGGTTIIIGPRGDVRYAINKNVNSLDREAGFLAYLRRMPDYADDFRSARPTAARLLRRLHQRVRRT